MELKKYKLGELIELQRGYDLPVSQMQNGIVPVAGSNGIIGWHNVSKIKPPCITIGRSGSVGKIHYYDTAIWPHNTSLFVKDFKGNDEKYIYYLLKTIDLSRLCDSSVVPSLNRNFIYPLEVEVYTDILQQKRIAHVLSTLDRKISLNRSINAELERMAKEIYDYWFVQFEFPDANGRPYKSSGGAMVYNPILKREIPEGWEVKQCKDLVNIVTGKEDANFSSPCGRYPFFTCSKDVLKCDIPAFNGSSVLIAGNGDFNVKHYTGKFNAYQRTYVLTPPQKYYGALFFAAFERIESFKSKSNGSIIKFITKGDIESLYVFDCKDDCVYNTINNLIYQIEKNTIQIEELAKIQNELLPLLMTGQVTIE